MDDFYGLNYEDWLVFFIKIFVCIIIISEKMRYVEKLTNQSGSGIVRVLYILLNLLFIDKLCSALTSISIMSKS